MSRLGALVRELVALPAPEIILPRRLVELEALTLARIAILSKGAPKPPLFTPEVARRRFEVNPGFHLRVAGRC